MQKSYSAYGPRCGVAVLSDTDTLLNELVNAHAWRGYRVDASGLISMGARYYDYESGRFISPDPLGHEECMDLYSYANGDPVNFLDPTGRNAFDPNKEYEVDLFGTGQKFVGTLQDIENELARIESWEQHFSSRSAELKVRLRGFVEQKTDAGSVALAVFGIDNGMDASETGVNLAALGLNGDSGGNYAVGISVGIDAYELSQATLDGDLGQISVESAELGRSATGFTSQGSPIMIVTLPIQAGVNGGSYNADFLREGFALANEAGFASRMKSKFTIRKMELKGAVHKLRMRRDNPERYKFLYGNDPNPNVREHTAKDPIIQYAR